MLVDDNDEFNANIADNHIDHIQPLGVTPWTYTNRRLVPLSSWQFDKYTPTLQYNTGECNTGQSRFQWYERAGTRNHTLVLYFLMLKL